MTEDSTGVSETDPTSDKIGASDTPVSPDIVEPEVLKKLPPEARKVVEIGMAMHRFSGPMPNPLTEKLTERHIDKILELAEKDDDRSFRDASESRRYALGYVLISALLFVFATVYLVGADKALYTELLKLLAVFIGGLGGGFGIKSYMDRDK